MTAPLKRYVVRTETIFHERITVPVPPAIVGLNEYDTAGRWPLDRDVGTSIALDCRELDKGMGR